MTAKHVTVEGLAAALLAASDQGEMDSGEHEWFIIGTREDAAAAILAALPDDCPAEAERDAAMADRDERESRRIDTEYELVINLGKQKDRADAADADAAALAEALRALTCQDDGTFNALRDDFPDGGDIVLRWDGNRGDWEVALAALAAHDRRVRGRQVPLAVEQAASEEPSSEPRRLDR